MYTLDHSLCLLLSYMMTIGARLAFCHLKSDQRVTKVTLRLQSYENIIASRATSLKDNYARLVTVLSIQNSYLIIGPPIAISVEFKYQCHVNVPK